MCIFAAVSVLDVDDCIVNTCERSWSSGGRGLYQSWLPHIYQDNFFPSAAREPGCILPASRLWKLPENQFSKADLSHGRYMEKRFCSRPLEILFVTAGAICCTGISCAGSEGLVLCIDKTNTRNQNFPLQVPQADFNLLPVSLLAGLNFLQDVTWCWKCWMQDDNILSDSKRERKSFKRNSVKQ